MNENKSKKILLVLSVCLVSFLLISNIIAGRLFLFFFDLTLPSSIFIFPFVYMLSSVITEIYGLKTARKIIALGFIFLIVSAIIYIFVISLPSPEFSAENNESFRIVLFSGIRALFGSIIAFLAGSLVNVSILSKLKNISSKNGERKNSFGARYILAIAVGEIIDSSLFITITFSMTMPNNDLFRMIIVQAITKIFINVVLTPFIVILINKINKSIRD